MDALATDEQNSMLDLRQMHQQGFTGDGVLIGVFDSGFATVDTSPYFTHLFTGEQVVATRDFIRNSNNIFQYDTHGTKVLSCIAAYDQTQYIGAAYGADFVLCVTEDIMGEYRVEEYNWLFAAEYADSLGVDVINSSVGYSYFDDPAMDYDYEDMDGETAIITQAALLAARKGMLVVSSNGNEGNSAWTYLNAPADADSILSVGAVNLDGMRANFSSFGPASDGRLKPDVSALGIWTKVVQNDAVVVSNGTSFSSPLIAGLAAGFWQAFPDLSSQEVIQYLKMSASQSTSPDTLTGFGVPSFVRAYSKVKINEGKIDNKFIVFPNPIDTVSGYRYIYIYNDIFSSGAEATFAIYDLKGLLVRELTLLLPEDPNPIELDISGLQPGSYILNCAVGSALQKSKLIVF
jgi:subtilisin family serine protease